MKKLVQWSPSGPSLSMLIVALSVIFVAVACGNDGGDTLAPDEPSASETCVICDDGTEKTPEDFVEVDWVGIQHNIRLDSARKVIGEPVCENAENRVLELATDSPHLALESDVKNGMADPWGRAGAGCDGPSQFTLSFAVDSMSAHLGPLAASLLHDIESALYNYTDLSSFIAEVETVEATAATYLAGFDLDAILSTASTATESASYWASELGDLSLASDNKILQADVKGCITVGLITGLLGGNPLAGCLAGGSHTPWWSG